MAVEQRIEKSNETVVGDVAADDAVELGADRRGRDIACGKGFDRRLHVRHQQRRRHALTADIGDADCGALLVELQHVDTVCAGRHAAAISHPRICGISFGNSRS